MGRNIGDAFEAAWRGTHPDFPPLGYLLRICGKAHWIRFHLLPGSKRWPETEAENVIVLSRLNTLATDVLGEGAACWLSQALPVYRQARDPELEPAFTFANDYADDETNPWRAWVKPIVWTRGALDPLLLEVAGDVTSGVVLMATGSGALFAPYDGGVDLFLPTPDWLESLRDRYPEWLPSNADGL